MRNGIVEQSNSVEWYDITVWNGVAQCGTVWWNSVEQYGGRLEWCGGTVEQYGGTVEQYGGTVEQCGGTVEQCGGTAWWNSGTVWQSVVEQCGTVW